MLPVRLVVSMAMMAFGWPGLALDIWGEGGYRCFAERLPRASLAMLERSARDYWPDLRARSGLAPENVRIAPFKLIDPVLDRAVRGRMGILDVFTLKELANPSYPALMLEAGALREIDEKYDLFSIWMIKAQSRNRGNASLQMDYLIVGQGQLLIGYPFGGPVEVINEGDRFEFVYEPLIQASIINRPGERGLFGLRTLARPNHEFQPFRGPMGAAIQSYVVEGKNIVVSYHLVIDQEVAIPQKPIALRRGQTALRDRPGGPFSSALVER